MNSQGPGDKLKPNDPRVCELVDRFGGMVHRLKFIHFGIKELFGTRESTRLLEETALLFFGDLNKVLIDYFYLEVSKLADPPKSDRGRQENLTTRYFIEFIDWPVDVRSVLENLHPTITQFWKTVKPARDKLIAHNDADAILSGASLGAFTIGDEEIFLKALETMANTLRSCCNGEIWGDMVETGPGDVLDLKAALIRGAAFDRLLRQSTGTEKRRLYDLLDQVKADFKSGDEGGSETDK